MSAGPTNVTAIAALLGSGKYSDLMLVHGDQYLKVHKAIVCPQSRVLAAACDGGFEESTTNSINISISQFSLETVNQMVKFMYTGNYDMLSNNVEELSLEPLTISEEVELASETDRDRTAIVNIPAYDGSNSQLLTDHLLYHIHINGIADYYDIPPLKQLANDRISQLLEAQWMATAFPKVVEHALSISGDPALHRLIATAAAVHIDELIELEEFPSPDIMDEFSLCLLKTIVKTKQSNETLLRGLLLDVETQTQEVQRQLAAAVTNCKAAEGLASWNALRTEEVRDNLSNCLRKLSETIDCRNTSCNAEFNCYIEQGGTGEVPTYTLRCASCHCRHK